MKRSFLSCDIPLLTAMIKCATPDECIEKIRLSVADGAEAIGVQLEWLKTEYRTKKHLERIFAACGELPIYVTSYRDGENVGREDGEIGELLVKAVACGATAADVMGDIYSWNLQYGLSAIPTEISRQLLLIKRIHRCGGEVIMSSRVSGKLSVPEYEMIASDQATRKADIIGIFNASADKADLDGYAKAVGRIKEENAKKLQLEFCGEDITLGDMASAGGLCMFRCVQSYGEYDSPDMPLLKDAKAIREGMYINK